MNRKLGWKLRRTVAGYRQQDVASSIGSTETLQWLLRGEASIHVAQIDHHLQLDPNRLLKLSWAASELAAKLEGR